MAGISPQQWLTAFVVAVVLHFLAATLVWAFENAPEQTSHSPRGVMVSLNALSVGNTKQAVTSPAPVQPVPASSNIHRATTTAPNINAAKPVPAIPTSPKPVRPTQQEPTKSESGDSIHRAGDVDIPVADTVTVKNLDTPEPVRKHAPVTAAQSHTTQSANQGSGAHGLSSNPTVTYIARIRSWLGQHKYYPVGARRAGAHGTVRLYIVIARDGEILNLAIARSSGYPVLDQAAMGMVKRAEPLPAMPDDMLRTRLEIILPVHYALSKR